jgi:CxxC motif-containing protein (DUF1111 family)
LDAEQEIKGRLFGLSASAMVTFSLIAIGVHGRNRSEGMTDHRALSGGGTTVFVTNKHAFGKSAANLPIESLRDFAFGNSVFNSQWVIAPASVESLDGLGPLFNRPSCAACHVRDGRGRPPKSPEAPMMSMLVRLSVRDDDGKPVADPVYGGQLQDRAIPGVDPEGHVSVSYDEEPGEFVDGTTYTLLRPRYEFRDLAYGELGEDTMFSPRVAPAIHGLGLLEAVAEETVLAGADPDDGDGDGISGRANYVTNSSGTRMLGRFGWKASVPTLRHQAAGAANGDIGITSSVFAEDEVTPAQAAGVSVPNGGAPELSEKQLDKLEFYLRTLAVPARRQLDDSRVQLGERLFESAQCTACHMPDLTTGDHPVVQLANQRIHPYTDMLLHDMGEKLADNRPDHEANGREWRTPPLWGIGLQKVVNGHTFLLHDGRARNVTEAILWHGGEAAASRDRFGAMSESDREALRAFVESL